MRCTPHKPVGLEELSAYVDGELGTDRRTVVERHLSNDAESASRVAIYRRHDDDLRQALAFLASDEPGNGSGIAYRREFGTRRTAGRRIAAIAAAVVLAVGAGAWWIRTMRETDRLMADLAHDATVAHFSYVSEREASREPANAALLTDRLRQIAGGHAVLPNLAGAGYDLIDGRLLGTPSAPALQLVYRNDAGSIVSCYFNRDELDSETDFAVKESDKINLVYRLDEGVGYAVVGTLRPTALMEIAKLEYEPGSE
jgi:anti-sigma factor RsiW